MAEFRIRFLPEGQETVVGQGTTLLEAARQANVYVGAICGGEGLCGKCRVVVREGNVEGEPTDLLTAEEIDRGYALACQVVAAGDLVVEIPPESRLSGYEGIGKASEQLRDVLYEESQPAVAGLDPVVAKCPFSLAEPTLDDPTADRERLLDAMAKECPSPIRMGLGVVRDLPRVLRKLDARRTSWKWQWDGQVTAAVDRCGDPNEILCVEPGDTSRRSFGLALDVGTTSVVGHLVDLTTGKTCEAAAKYNSQIEYGADVISRINYARQPGGAEALHKAVSGDIETMIADLVERAEIDREQIYCAVAAGNTVMEHLFLGLESDLIRISPFVPAATSPPPVRAADVGVRIHPEAILHVLPVVGSYVGGDITAGILFSGLHESDELSLLIDMGTNGEVVLGNKEFMVACAASAGPAFEGGSVTCGMRATSGAIDRVKISNGDPRVTATTIDGSPPVGICGTGLIDALAGMLLAGVVDRSGAYQIDWAKDRFRESQEDGRAAFVLAAAGETGGSRDVIITQADIENLILTKASIYAAADSLVQSVGLSWAEVQKVYIAGAFGNHLDVGHCIAIGLLPDVPPQRIEFLGNSSLGGAKQVLLSRARFEKVREIRDRMTYQELMVEPAYMERLTSARFLPHTDLSLFPTIAEKLDNRGSASQESETVNNH